MKINFNENGMAINFDKVPKLIYFNEEGYGCGAAFIDGTRIKNLVKTEIEANTNDDKPRVLKYRITQHDGESHSNKYTGNMDNKLSNLEIPVRILDLKEFRLIIDILKKVIYDDRMPEVLRQEYKEKLALAMNSHLDKEE